MEKKNRFKLIAMAGACAACIMVPASLAFSDYKDDLLVDSYYKDILDVLSTQDSLLESDDILLEDNSEGTIGSYDEILVSDAGYSGGYSDEDILIADEGGSYEELLVDAGDDSGSSSYTYTPAFDPSSIDEDLLVTKPVVTTPTPTPKPADSNTVKAAMAPKTGTSTVNTSPTTSADGTASAASSINTVISEINSRRASAGVAPLESDSVLNYVATQRVKETTKKFSHTRPNGKESVTILSDYGVSAGRTGENIACCISSPEGVVSAWANSPSHNRCMLNADYTHAGVGTIVSDGCTYWVLILTN